MSKTASKGRWSALIARLRDIVTDLTSHWKKPARGKFVPYKEVINYSIGGMGWNCMIYVMSFLGLGAGNTLIGSTIGIRPMHLQLMAAIQSTVGILFPIIRGKMVDNTRTKYGRFRPYILFTGLPLLIMCAVYIWLPFESMAYRDKLIATFCLTLAISFVTPLFTDTYGELGSCLTPNTAERTNIFAVSSIIYSFAPTVYYAAVPMLSNLTGGFTDIRTYKYIIIPVGIIGVLLSLFTVFGCKERVVSSKNYVQKVGLIEGVKAVYANKYWRIRMIATLLGFLEMASGVIFGWIYIYSTQDMIMFGILNTIWGTASGLSMLVTPWVLKKLGNKRTLILHNASNIVFSIFMMMTFKMPGVYFVFMYLNTFVNQLQIVYNPVLNAEVKDSIQFDSGKRLDFTLGAAWTVLAPIQIASGFLIPFVYEVMGLTVNYDVLYDPVVRNDLFYVICVCSIVGAALNLIPFFFYNLSREKHEMMILALRYRAANSDYSTGDITSHQIREVVEMYNMAEQMHSAESVDVKALLRAYLAIRREKVITDDMRASATWQDKVSRKAMIREARAEHKARLRSAWQEYRQGEKLMSYKEAYREVLEGEYTKYDTPLSKVRYEVSRMIADIELDDIKTTDIDFSAITWDAVDPDTAKKIERYIARVARAYAKMQSIARTKYSTETLVNTYRSDLMAAIDEPAYTDEEKKAHDRRVTELEKRYHLFLRQFKCWNDAIAYVHEVESVSNFERYIIPMYETAKAEADELDRQADERERREYMEHKLDMATARVTRQNRKRAKKGLEPLPLPTLEELFPDTVEPESEEVDA